MRNLRCPLEQSPALAKTLTIGQVSGLAVSLVVGNGLLVLPGLAYARSGGAALYAWIIAALLTLPLLVMLTHLGRSFPGAGGVAGFMQAAFSRPAGAAAELLILGTVLFSEPAVAIVGGHYVGLFAGSGQASVLLPTLAFFAVACGINLLQARISGRIQQVTCYILVATLACALLLALLVGDHSRGTPVASPLDWREALPSLSLVFYAWTGWEALACTAEEHRNPRRDFRLAVLLAYLAIVLLYLGVALAVQLTLPRPGAVEALTPVVAMLSSVFGAASGRVVALFGIVLMLINLTSLIWASSRLVTAMARERVFPAAVGRIHRRTRIPHLAVLAITCAFAGMAILYFLGALPLTLLYSLSGQNFLVLYALCACAYIKLARTAGHRLFGICTLCVLLLAVGLGGWGALYPLALLCGGAALEWYRYHRRIQQKLSDAARLLARSIGVRGRSIAPGALTVIQVAPHDNERVVFDAICSQNKPTVILLPGKSAVFGHLQAFHTLKRLQRRLDLQIAFVIPPCCPLLLRWAARYHFPVHSSLEACVESYAPTGDDSPLRHSNGIHVGHVGMFIGSTLCMCGG